MLPLLTQAADEKVVAIGETGLDYFYSPENKDVQQASFREHIRVARALNKPLIIHTGMPRKTRCGSCERRGPNRWAECCTVHRVPRNGRGRDGHGVLYFHLGDSHFKNASALQAVVKALPLERLLVETDSPYLAPVPHRGRENEPAFVRDVAQFIADLRQISARNWRRPPATISSNCSSWQSDNRQRPA
jgi:TatD DNase family protein